MSVILDNSQTKINLMRAFAGESQARNRYTLAAETAKEEKLFAIERIFLFTAEQEMAHAEVFYSYLAGFDGQNITLDGAYPVNTSKDVATLLQYAHHNEMQEFDDVYASFSRTAAEEGFASIAASFEAIGKIELEHAKRFAYLYEQLKNKTLYVKSVESGWMCLNCGHIYRGLEVPPKCPVCSHDRGYFISLELAPYWNNF